MPKKTNKKSAKHNAKAALEPTGKCLCGCGKKANNFFLQGHDAKLRSKFVEHAYGDKKHSFKKEQVRWALHKHWMNKDIKSAIPASLRS